MTLSPLVWQVPNPFQAAVLADLLSALIAHAWFRKYEPENISSGLVALAVFAVAPIATTVITLPSPLINGPFHVVLFVFLLLCSILLYRMSPFHPLAKQPGPVICKISKLWFAWVSYQGKLHLYLDELHKKYGPVVRIGPNELSIVEAPLIPQILGQQGMPKGPMWDARSFVPGRKMPTTPSLIGIRDTNVHAKFRKLWNRAFAPAILKDYEEFLVARGMELVELLKGITRDSPDGVGHADISMRISQWSFDFMGDIIFGEDFGLMRTNDKDRRVHSLDEAQLLPAVSQMVPWAKFFLGSIPSLADRAKDFGNFASQQGQKRIAKTTGKKDLFYHLATNMDSNDDQPPLPLVMSNSVLGIVAGSHTTSHTISNIIYYLLRQPEYLRRLQKELDMTFPPSEQAVIQINKLANLELLDAIVNEALRLQPPVSTYLQRAPPVNSGGKFLNDLFIPEGTSVIVPPYAIHRDRRYFSPDPDEFWPERWFMSSEKITLEKSAFIPFSYGPANCVGRPLALLELRYIVAILVYNFNLSFEEGYNPDQWDKDLFDRYVVIKGGLPVKMEMRNV